VLLLKQLLIARSTGSLSLHGLNKQQRVLTWGSARHTLSLTRRYAAITHLGVRNLQFDHVNLVTNTTRCVPWWQSTHAYSIKQRVSCLTAAEPVRTSVRAGLRRRRRRSSGLNSETKAALCLGTSCLLRSQWLPIGCARGGLNLQDNRLGKRDLGQQPPSARPCVNWLLLVGTWEEQRGAIEGHE
jgi:hypothetical protein